ncbi:hypothetical protein B296_00008448 [Ensete ventricosum]|uniref:Uncharacterized protein n=1 Tax=Ensete ventricosum TaxID=4639 RepID=A0A426Z886_ENSVE|nr:hypothetical protein B296_00008448 [Ensete ventricosum]
MIMRRYDQELLGAPLWYTTQQEDGLWIQGVNVVVLQRRVFVCASELALDESLKDLCISSVIKRDEEATTSPEGLSYTKVKRRGRTIVELSIPCSHGVLVVKGAKEVENAEANSKYQDKAEGRRPRNFIRRK